MLKLERGRILPNKRKGEREIEKMIANMGQHKLIELSESLMNLTHDMLEDISYYPDRAHRNVELYKKNLRHIQNRFERG